MSIYHKKTCHNFLLFSIGMISMSTGILFLADYIDHKHDRSLWSLWIGFITTGSGFVLLLVCMFYSNHVSTTQQGTYIDYPLEAIAPFLPAVGPAPMLSPSPSAPYYYSKMDSSVRNAI
jgi:hypothetical protein